MDVVEFGAVVDMDEEEVPKVLDDEDWAIVEGRRLVLLGSEEAAVAKEGLSAEVDDEFRVDVEKVDENPVVEVSEDESDEKNSVEVTEVVYCKFELDKPIEDETLLLAGLEVVKVVKRPGGVAAGVVVRLESPNVPVELVVLDCVELDKTGLRPLKVVTDVDRSTAAGLADDVVNRFDVE